MCNLPPPSTPTIPPNLIPMTLKRIKSRSRHNAKDDNLWGILSYDISIISNNLDHLFHITLLTLAHKEQSITEGKELRPVMTTVSNVSFNRLDTCVSSCKSCSQTAWPLTQHGDKYQPLSVSSLRDPGGGIEGIGRVAALRPLCWFTCDKMTGCGEIMRGSSELDWHKPDQGFRRDD